MHAFKSQLYNKLHLTSIIPISLTQFLFLAILKISILHVYLSNTRRNRNQRQIYS